MTREQFKQFIKTTFGIEEPTEEMITGYLNNVNGAVKAEKDKADALKADADLAKDLQAKLDAINAEKMTDIEKANKEAEKANSKVEELQKQLDQMKTRTELPKIGIIGDQAEQFFKEDGTVNFEILSQVISEREEKASSLKEKEILKSTPNPNGTDPGNKETEAERFAKELGQNMANTNKVTSDVLSHYTT